MDKYALILLQQLMSLKNYFNNKMCHWFTLETEGYTLSSKMFTTWVKKKIIYMQYTEYTASMGADTQFEFASLHNMLAFIYAITQNTIYKLQHVGQPNISKDLIHTNINL